jgi:hypothetical protein
MSSDATTWSCVISLILEYDKDGKPTPMERKSFGPRIVDKNVVDIWLRRAQAAILSPHLSVDTLTSKTLEELKTMRGVDPKMLKFSKNTIHVDIMDPDATDLSFVDLPGENNSGISLMISLHILFRFNPERRPGYD